MENAWVKQFLGSITVCDRQGAILEMNDASIETFRSEGGENLLGANLLDCHPEPARSKVRRMLEAEQANIYTIEKEGTKKLVCQVPWYLDGFYKGFVELVIPLPRTMPHFIRDA